MARRRISEDVGRAAIKNFLENSEPNSEHLVTAVRFLLEEFADRLPGNSVEVRVPPIGAIQCIGGPKHSRGTPPNVVEMSPKTWFDLATGITNWGQAIQMNLVSVSGVRSDLSAFLPIHEMSN